MGFVHSHTFICLQLLLLQEITFELRLSFMEEPHSSGRKAQAPDPSPLHLFSPIISDYSLNGSLSEVWLRKCPRFEGGQRYELPPD